MKTIGNILWFLLGGIIIGTSWIICGFICCITIVGIPIGLQCFKFASLGYWPFGKEVQFGGGAPSLLANIIWLIFLGIPMAISDVCIGIAYCVTIVGIPFGLQCFKIAKLSLMPFGAEIVNV